VDLLGVVLKVVGEERRLEERRRMFLHKSCSLSSKKTVFCKNTVYEARRRPEANDSMLAWSETNIRKFTAVAGRARFEKKVEWSQ
jgi:hypothetical protein